jgi:hypothetical protein
MNTPWGKSDHTEQFARGFGSVSTPSHGGFYLSTRFADEHLSPAAIKRGDRLGDYLFYEEDALYAIPALELRGFWPEIFSRARPATEQEREHQLALTIASYWPDYLEEVGFPLDDPEIAERAEQGRQRKREWAEQDRARHEREEQDLAALPPDALQAGFWGTNRRGVIIVKTADGRCFAVKRASFMAAQTRAWDADRNARPLLRDVDVVQPMACMD